MKAPHQVIIDNYMAPLNERVFGKRYGDWHINRRLATMSLQCFGRYRESEYDFLFDSEEERLAERKRLRERLDKIYALMDLTSVKLRSDILIAYREGNYTEDQLEDVINNIDKDIAPEIVSRLAEGIKKLIKE